VTARSRPHGGLPALLNEVASVAGVEAALTLARVKGGQRVYIPARLPPEHWLTEELGSEAAGKVARHFAQDGVGAYLDIPLGPGGSYASQRRQRAQLMKAAIDEGLSANAASRAVGITWRSVYRAKAKARHSRQPGLFDED
jgi:hypothetical protein